MITKHKLCLILIVKMYGTAYQLEQNKKLRFDFRQDLKVIERLIEKENRVETMDGVFGKSFSVATELFPEEWKDFEFDLPMAKNVKHTEFDGIGFGPLRLLLLLGYIMTTAVGEDESVTSQM